MISCANSSGGQCRLPWPGAFAYGTGMAAVCGSITSSMYSLTGPALSRSSQ